MKEGLNDILNTWLDSRLFDIHTILPGQIEEYLGHAERKAKVKPLVKPRLKDNQTLSIQPISNVPVMFPSTGNFNMLYPLKKGDGCLLLFSEAAIGNYLGSNVEQDAEAGTRFQLTDCICIPGLWSFKNVPKPAPENDTDFFLKFQNALIQMKDKTNDIVIKNEQGSITIDTAGVITIENSVGKINVDPAGNITLNDGTEAYVLGTTLDTWISATLLTIFNAHTHTAPSGATGPPNSPLTPPVNYLSTQIKGK